MVIDCIDADTGVVVMMLHLLEVLFRADIMLPYRSVQQYCSTCVICSGLKVEILSTHSKITIACMMCKEHNMAGSSIMYKWSFIE